MVKQRNVVKNSSASIIKSDLEVLFRIIDHDEIKTILEIGTWRGYSAKTFIEEFNPNLFITIEHDKPIEAIEIKKENYHYLWSCESNQPLTLEKVKSILKGGKVDFLFIDGGHKFPIVESDWDMYCPLVRVGGIVAFHDVCILQTNEQVKAFWEWVIKPKYNYIEIKTDKQSTGIGVVYL